MFDLVVKRGRLPDGNVADIGIRRDRIAEVGRIEPSVMERAGRVIDADGDLVSPPFVDPHFHMDATLSYGLPRVNASGTLLEGIALWGELREIAAVDGIDGVFVGPSDLAASMGLLGQQTHPDVTAAVIRAFEAVRSTGTPVGVNAFDPRVAQSYLDAGAAFVLVGADVAIAVWAMTPGEGWLARLLGNPVTLPFTRFAYDRFADLLYAWNRRKGHW